MLIEAVYFTLFALQSVLPQQQNPLCHPVSLVTAFFPPGVAVERVMANEEGGAVD